MARDLPFSALLVRPVVPPRKDDLIKGLIDDMLALVKAMAWCRTDDKALPEPIALLSLIVCE